MPAATNRAELLDVTGREYARLDAQLRDLPGKIACMKDVDDTSIKDVVAHRAHWIDLFLGWFADGQAGREVCIPAPGYSWADLKAYNAELRARQSGLSWDEARAMLAARHDALCRFLADQRDAGLYGAPMVGGNGKWTAGRYAEAAGPSHYRSAAKYVRARLRDVAPR